MKKDSLNVDDVYISFIEEMVLNPEYEGYIGGRIEVTHPPDRAYHSEEIRFFTQDIDGFNKFRDVWDMRVIDHPTLSLIRNTVKKKYSGRTIH